MRINNFLRQREASFYLFSIEWIDITNNLYILNENVPTDIGNQKTILTSKISTFIEEKCWNGKPDDHFNFLKERGSKFGVANTVFQKCNCNSNINTHTNYCDPQSPRKRS